MGSEMKLCPLDLTDNYDNLFTLQYVHAVVLLGTFVIVVVIPDNTVLQLLSAARVFQVQE